MNKKNLLHNEIEFVKERQVINMGGPWIGNLIFKGKLLSKECIVDNYVFDDIDHKIFFVKYHSITGNMNGVFFSINFHMVKDERLFEYEKRFETLFIKNVVNDKLEIFEAFHDKIEKYKTYFDLNEKFTEVSS